MLTDDETPSDAQMTLDQRRAIAALYHDERAALVAEDQRTELAPEGDDGLPELGE